MVIYMINIYTVSFFGHREVEDFLSVESQIENLIVDLISTKEYVEFLVGRNGAFDQLVSSVIRRVKRNIRDDNNSHILVLPYNTAEYSNNYDSFNEYYDDVEIYSGQQRTHFKAAFQKRNRYMVERSDLSVFYVERECGGAYQTYMYAKKQRKNILKLEM